MSQLKTIKETRKLLARWGTYWSKQEFGQGYSNKSSTQKLRETLELGCSTSSSYSSQQSDLIYEPEDLKQVSEALEQLKPEFLGAVVKKYIKKEKVQGFYIMEAERTIMMML